MKKRLPKNDARADSSVADRLLERYLAGHDTETGFIVDVLNITDESAIQHALAIMPQALFERFAISSKNIRPKRESSVARGRKCKRSGWSGGC